MEPVPSAQGKPAAAPGTPLRATDGAARPLTRAVQIERDMEEWRKNNPDRDFGREM